MEVQSSPTSYKFATLDFWENRKKEIVYVLLKIQALTRLTLKKKKKKNTYTKVRYHLVNLNGEHKKLFTESIFSKGNTWTYTT